MFCDSRLKCKAEENCKNSEGSHTCPCRTGFGRDSAELCVDEDECQTDAAVCPTNSVCKNTIGSFTCACDEGFDEDSLGSCVDINECIQNEDLCSQDHECRNTVGSFECKQKSVQLLVLSSRKGWKPTVIIDQLGRKKELNCFEKEKKVEAYGSCFLKWNNKLHVFGGDYEKRQISRLDGYRLKRIGSLSFNHMDGTCTIMNDTIFLCFNTDNHYDSRKCRKSNSPTGVFTEIPSSFYRHPWSTVSSSDSKLIDTN